SRSVAGLCQNSAAKKTSEIIFCNRRRYSPGDLKSPGEWAQFVSLFIWLYGDLVIPLRLKNRVWSDNQITV
ncbi:MAG TPA: hypothetical protein PK228_21570, partial [Saprospiraceae bacterium]|nr:hypothetical protein [Saprospiraceae bacterium]